jgi:hypothetical protein
MKAEVGSQWRDDDARVRAGKKPRRTLTVLAVGPTTATVRCEETGKQSDIQLGRFGRRGRLLPVKEPATSPQRASIPMRVSQSPARDAVRAVIERNLENLRDWQSVATLLDAALTEARIEERTLCLGEVLQSYSVQGAAEYIRRGLASIRKK